MAVNIALLVWAVNRAYDAAVAQLFKKNRLAGSAEALLFAAARWGTTKTKHRRFMRYPLRALAVFQWEGSKGAHQQGRGWTKDISEAGAYVVSSQCPSEGAAIQLLLKFPVRAASSGRAMEFDMNGSVLRVDRDAVHGRELGFAVLRRDARSSVEPEALDTAREEDEGPQARPKALQAN